MDNVTRPNDCIQENFDKYQYKVQRILDELQASIVLSGGMKLPVQKLASTPFGDLLFMCLPNKINFKITKEGIS